MKEGRKLEDIRRLGFEQLRFDNPDSGIDKRRHLAGLAPLQPSLPRHGEIAWPVDAHGAGGCGDEKQNVHLRGIIGLSEATNVRARSFDPKCVAVAQKERITADERKRALNAAALVKKSRPFIRDHNLRRIAIGEMRLDLI